MIKKLESKIDTHYDYIVNLSGYVDHSDKSEIISNHYNGCKNLASLFVRSKIKKYVQIGSSIEYGKIKSPQKENKKISKNIFILWKS